MCDAGNFYSMFFKQIIIIRNKRHVFTSERVLLRYSNKCFVLILPSLYRNTVTIPELNYSKCFWIRDMIIFLLFA